MTKSVNHFLTYLPTNLLTFKPAFTLAEVLITLGIIGVVAAMTIPGLMTKYQQAQTVTKLKKTYSVLQQAIRMASEEYGDCEGWDYSLSKGEFIDRYFAPYIKLSKVSMDYNFVDLQGVKLSYPSYAVKFMLPDGELVIFGRVDGFQVKNFLVVDINGNAKPNRTGRDLFAFTFYNNILTTYTQYQNINWKRDVLMLPGGTSGQCSKEASGGVIGSGSYCSRLIELDGWKISKDYPWN